MTRNEAIMNSTGDMPAVLRDTVVIAVEAIRTIPR